MLSVPGAREPPTERTATTRDCSSRDGSTGPSPQALVIESTASAQYRRSGEQTGCGVKDMALFRKSAGTDTTMPHPLARCTLGTNVACNRSRRSRLRPLRGADCGPFDRCRAQPRRVASLPDLDLVPRSSGREVRRQRRRHGVAARSRLRGTLDRRGRVQGEGAAEGEGARALDHADTLRSLYRRTRSASLRRRPTASDGVAAGRRVLGLSSWLSCRRRIGAEASEDAIRQRDRDAGDGAVRHDRVLDRRLCLPRLRSADLFCDHFGQTVGRDAGLAREGEDAADAGA